MLKSFTQAALCSLALTVSSAALAGPVYEFTDNNANTGGPGGDVLESIYATWDPDNEVLHWESVLSNSAVDSFWLVINDKDNPKQVDTNELVIMYGDLDKGIVTSYVYNGANNSNSYNTPGIYLQTDTLTQVGNTISFDIDATIMNQQNYGPDYVGIIAGPSSIGIWYHLAQNSTFIYDGDEILSYRRNPQSWYDRANLPMNEVPAPGGLALLGLGLLLLGRTRKQQQ